MPAGAGFWVPSLPSQVSRPFTGTLEPSGPVALVVARVILETGRRGVGGHRGGALPVSNSNSPFTRG